MLTMNSNTSKEEGLDDGGDTVPEPSMGVAAANAILASLAQCGCLDRATAAAKRFHDATKSLLSELTELKILAAEKKVRDDNNDDDAKEQQMMTMPMILHRVSLLEKLMLGGDDGGDGGGGLFGIIEEYYSLPEDVRLAIDLVGPSEENEGGIDKGAVAAAVAAAEDEAATPGSVVVLPAASSLGNGAGSETEADETEIEADETETEAEEAKKTNQKPEDEDHSRILPTESRSGDDDCAAVVDTWTEYIDWASGRVYYHNEKSGETTWERPGADADENWKQYTDDASGEAYYHNEKTGETTWQRPGRTGTQKGYGDDEAGLLFYYNERTGMTTWERSDSGGPYVIADAWTEHTDEATGHRYYYNRKTGETRWDPQVAPVFWARALMAGL